MLRPLLTFLRKPPCSAFSPSYPSRICPLSPFSSSPSLSSSRNPLQHHSHHQPQETQEQKQQDEQQKEPEFPPLSREEEEWLWRTGGKSLISEGEVEEGLELGWRARQRRGWWLSLLKILVGYDGWMVPSKKQDRRFDISSVKLTKGGARGRALTLFSQSSHLKKFIVKGKGEINLTSPIFREYITHLSKKSIPLSDRLTSLLFNPSPSPSSTPSSLPPFSLVLNEEVVGVLEGLGVGFEVSRMLRLFEGQKGGKGEEGENSLRKLLDLGKMKHAKWYIVISQDSGSISCNNFGQKHPYLVVFCSPDLAARYLEELEVEGEVRPVGEEFLRGVSGESRVGCVYGMEDEERVEVILCGLESLKKE